MEPATHAAFVMIGFFMACAGGAIVNDRPVAGVLLVYWGAVVQFGVTSWL